MISLLLAIIYIAFISLGLPDSLLGSAWPVMYRELSAPISYAGIISMIISGGTIISSLFSDKLTRKLGTGLVTAISVFLTAAALFGFSVSNSFMMLCVFAVPYGLGAGAVDAALNNYVSLHYSSRHMSWLHCFWGVGASISPYIMGYAIGSGHGWRTGYGIVSAIQIVLTVFLFFSLPLWKKKTSVSPDSEDYEAPLGLADALKIKGVVSVLITFFSYCAFESTCGLWASSYLYDKNRRCHYASWHFVYRTSTKHKYHSADWTDDCRTGRCACVSFHYSFHAGKFRKGKLPCNHWNPDGMRLCRQHLYAACFRISC